MGARQRGKPFELRDRAGSQQSGKRREDLERRDRVQRQFQGSAKEGGWGKERTEENGFGRVFETLRDRRMKLWGAGVQWSYVSSTHTEVEEQVTNTSNEREGWRGSKGLGRILREQSRELGGGYRNPRSFAGAGGGKAGGGVERAAMPSSERPVGSGLPRGLGGAGGQFRGGRGLDGRERRKTPVPEKLCRGQRGRDPGRRGSLHGARGSGVPLRRRDWGGFGDQGCAKPRGILGAGAGGRWGHCGSKSEEEGPLRRERWEG
jgi:hypothetical protein